MTNPIEQPDWLINLKALKEMTGHGTVTGVEQWLKANNVRYLHGKKGPFTTRDALHAAMGLSSNNTQPIAQKPDEIIIL